jgi:hypothetical protein
MNLGFISLLCLVMTFDATYEKTFACSRGRKERRNEKMCMLSHNNKVL